VTVKTVEMHLGNAYRKLNIGLTPETPRRASVSRCAATRDGRSAAAASNDAKRPPSRHRSAHPHPRSLWFLVSSLPAPAERLRGRLRRIFHWPSDDGQPAHDALPPTSCTIVDYYDDRELTREGISVKSAAPPRTSRPAGRCGRVAPRDRRGPGHRPAPERPDSAVTIAPGAELIGAELAPTPQ
jgi:hypothetical protein